MIHGALRVSIAEGGGGQREEKLSEEHFWWMLNELINRDWWRRTSMLGQAVEFYHSLVTLYNGEKDGNYIENREAHPSGKSR